MNPDKIFVYAPIVLIIFVLLGTLVIEIMGCKWDDLFSLEFDSMFAPGIRVIG